MNPSRRVPIIGPNGVRIINPIQPQDPLGPGGMQPMRPLGPGGMQPIGPLYNQGTLNRYVFEVVIIDFQFK